jgi:hypothetical protein
VSATPRNASLSSLVVKLVLLLKSARWSTDSE